MGLTDDPVRAAADATAARRLPGKVTLVGAGPGAADLLTLRAARALQQAEVVLYDHLVSRDVLDLVPADAELVYVGKASGSHSLPQAQIIELMLQRARSGRPLVRLKGGDPYVFGRGGEEAQALARAGVPFEVVPGVSAAQGAAACAGIPLTHRDHAGAVVFATGHLREDGRGGSDVELDWGALARPHQTAVIYMGLATLPRTCEQLVAHGMSPDTPAAVVERATCADQRTITGTLRTLPQQVKSQGVRSPALVMVGTVVSLHGELAPPAAATRCGHGPEAG
jgi:uroporphyrin-III C-methyltransferase